MKAHEIPQSSRSFELSTPSWAGARSAGSSDMGRDASCLSQPGFDIDRVNRVLASADAIDVVRWAERCFPGSVVLSSSFGADSAVMLHLVTQVVPNIPVILIDTGYLFAETYRFAELLRHRLNLNLVVRSANCTAARQEAVFGRLWEQGEEALRRYHHLNKVEPMDRALRELRARAWLSGIRAEQTEHRRTLPKVAWQDGRVKVHPLIDWTKDRVSDYLEQHKLPRHPLYEQGFRSIGDWHSTVAVDEEVEDDRAGRRLGENRECGLHDRPARTVSVRPARSDNSETRLRTDL
jgi:phosphoadenosine phosphosulfate reductase